MAGMSARQLQALQHLIKAQQKNDDGLLSFRAGRMTMDDDKMVTAKNERGKIKFYKSDEGLLHLEWINRISNRSGMDIIIFPDSAKWVKVEECKDGRVFVLKFNGSRRREFFWMQEPSDEKDNEITEKINKLISGGDSNASGANAAAAAGLGDFGGALGAFGGLGGTGATGGSGSGNTGGAGGGNDFASIFMNALQQQMQSTVAGTGGNNTGANANQNAGNPLMQAMLAQQLAQREELKKEPDLSDILDPSQNEIQSVLDDEKVIERLAEHLPEEMRDAKSILEQLSSPQFLASLSRLNHIINSPEMTQLLGQMGIQATGDKIGVKAFIEAVTKANNNNNGSNDNKDKDNNDNNNSGSGGSGTSAT